MNDGKLIKLLIKSVILTFFLPLICGAAAFSHLLHRILRKALKEKGRDEVIRLLSYKGIFGIFALISRKIINN